MPPLKEILTLLIFELWYEKYIFKRRKGFILCLLCIAATISAVFYLEYIKNIKRLNVILITIDALRADHLGCYGYKRNTSPNIDRLAQEGIRAAHAISQGPETTHSIASLMTALYPSQVIYTALLGERCSQDQSSLAQTLKENGYYTGAAGSYNLYGKGCDAYSRGFVAFDLYSHDDNISLTQWAIDFLDRNKDRRFFLWVHYLDPHGPYRPPAPYNRKFLNDNLYNTNKKIPIDFGGMDSSPLGKIPAYIAENGITEVDYYIAQYDGEISWTDEHVGILLKKIESLDLNKKSFIILTADHGEYLGEHDIYFEHAVDLYDSVLRVPLIFKCDRILPAGEIINHQVGLIDIMPTVFGLLKMKPKNKIEGIDLLPFILKRDKDFPREIIFSEKFYSSPEGTLAEKIGLRTGEWKLKYDSSRPEEYELYNLKEDHLEMVNLVDIEKKQLEYLRIKLQKHMDRLARSKLEITPLPKPVDKQNQERIRALGYLQ